MDSNSKSLGKQATALPIDPSSMMPVTVEDFSYQSTYLLHTVDNKHLHFTTFFIYKIGNTRPLFRSFSVFVKNVHQVFGAEIRNHSLMNKSPDQTKAPAPIV